MIGRVATDNKCPSKRPVGKSIRNFIGKYIKLSRTASNMSCILHAATAQFNNSNSSSNNANNNIDCMTNSTFVLHCNMMMNGYPISTIYKSNKTLHQKKNLIKINIKTSNCFYIYLSFDRQIRCACVNATTYVHSIVYMTRIYYNTYVA